PPPHGPGRRDPQSRRLREARRGPAGLPARAGRPAPDLPRKRTARRSSMTYFEGFIVPVPEANRDAFRKHADQVAALLGDVGVRRQVEAWGDDVPEGKVTDFRKAVDATADEKAVFAWFEYPDRQARDAANEKMMSDERMAELGTD